MSAGVAEAVSVTAATRAALDAARAEPTIFAAVEAERALAQAEALDRTAAAGGGAGPLHGAILAHKDMFDRAGQATGKGGHPSAARIATETSTVLARLDAAGQVDLGRLRMSEFAMGPTGHNAHWGVARNAYVPGGIPGGSSSGSGAAVAAGLVRAALGSDTGGSIRVPAACCGVVGFKPTQGRVPVTGVMPLSFTQDCVGPLARTVADARLVLSLISGPDGRDPVCADKPAPRATGAALPPGLRVGFDASGYAARAAPAVLAGLATVRDALGGVGAAPLDVDLAFFDTLGEPANVVAMSEAAAVHADRLAVAADTYGPQVRARLLQAAAMPGFAYVRSLQIRQSARAILASRVFDKVDLLILPTLADVPPMADAVDLGNREGVAQLVGGLVHFTRPINLLGLPALSLPVKAAGAVSVQIVGPAWSEDLIADLGEALERALAA